MANPTARRVRKFLQASGELRWLAVQSFALLICVRLLLLLPYRAWRALFNRSLTCSPDSAPTSTVITPGAIASNVRTAAEYVPGAECLPQSITAKFLMNRYGHEAELHVGVGREEDGRFQAHAWLDGPDGLLLGGQQGAKHYSALPLPREDHS